MKKVLFAISFICYFAVTSGIVINSHYCMKRLVSVHLFEKKAKVCGRCGMGMHDGSGCCHDEAKFLKLTQDQTKTVYLSLSIEKLAPQVSIPSAFIQADFTPFVPSHHFFNHSPPLLSGKDTYLVNRVFRI